MAVVLVAVFYLSSVFKISWQGLKPAVTSPPENIAEVINTTGMPLKLPAGFSISIFAKDLIAPRVIKFDPAGNLVASITSEGKVVVLPDKNGDGRADSEITILSGLNKPHGLAFKCDGDVCKLYVAETDKIVFYDYDKENLKAANKKKLTDLPSGAGHFTRTIEFGPDSRLYVSIGSSCNVCNETDSRRAKIFSMNADGGDFKEFARGLRNAVFFTWSYVDGRMWATEMGRDYLGDYLPPDEINIIGLSTAVSGRNSIPNFGWPTCYGKNIHDTDFDKNTYIRNPCMEPFEAPSYIDLPAHSAPLGLAFIPEEGWPQEYWYNLLVAYHGSWNRTVPDGYKIVRMKLDAKGNYSGVEDFITGWLTPDNQALGRPVDILVQPGGTMYISDDKAGVIYRVTYFGNKRKE